MSLYPESVYENVEPGAAGAAAAAVVQSEESAIPAPMYWDDIDVQLRNATPELRAYVWFEVPDLERFVWCDQCCRVGRVGDIWLCDNDVYCEFCENPITSVYWWDGWLRFAAVGWVPNPEPGTYYFLPGSVYLDMRDGGSIGYVPFEYKENEKRFLTAPPPCHTHDGEWDDNAEC